MSTFNINRFAQALKCQFLVMRKMWIRLFGIFTHGRKLASRGCI